MLKDAPSKFNNKEVKDFYRRMLKALHPDLGGDKEEFIKFLSWFTEEYSNRINNKPEVVKTLPLQGNYFYRCEEFTLEEILTLKKKTLILPIEKKCPDCGGTGYDRIKTQVCGNCLGRGLIETFNQRNNDKVYVQCPFCGGKGRVFRYPCSTCSGKGTIREELEVVIDLPFGLEEGDYLYLPKDRFNLPQDVFVEVVIKDHPNFKREGRNLICECALTVWDLLLSDYVEIPTLEGRERILTADLRTSQEVVLKSRGLYYYEGEVINRGDLIIKVKVVFPKEIPLELKECLKSSYEAYIKNMRKGVEGYD